MILQAQHNPKSRALRAERRRLITEKIKAQYSLESENIDGYKAPELEPQKEPEPEVAAAPEVQHPLVHATSPCVTIFPFY